MKSTSIVILLLATILVSHARGQKPDEDVERRVELRFGKFKLAINYTESSSRDKLRLSKSTYKWNVDLPFLGSLEYKQSHSEQLVRCDKDLALVEPEFLKLIDCKPLDAHILDDSFRSIGINTSRPSSSNTIRFVRSQIIKIKVKSPLRDGSRRLHIRLYPMIQSVIDRNIDSVIRTNDLGKLESDSQTYNLGYYFESEDNDPGMRGVSSSGEIFLTANSSDLNFGFLQDSDLDLYDELRRLVSLADNGMFFSIRHTMRPHPGNLDSQMTNPLTFENKITIVAKHEFPYLFVEHNMNISLGVSIPIWEYSGSIVQTSGSNSRHPVTYNTTIHLDSISAFSKGLNAKLFQVFQINGNSGEEMMKYSTGQSAVEVTGEWSPGNYKKVLRYFLVDGVNLRSINDIQKDRMPSDDGKIKLHRAFELVFAKLQEDSFIDVRISILKSFLASFFKSDATPDSHENMVRDEL